jgi:single-strand DNA-binding protein
MTSSLEKFCGEYLPRVAGVREGKLQTRSYDDKEGVKRHTTEIIAADVQFLGGRDPAADVPTAGPPRRGT